MGISEGFSLCKVARYPEVGHALDFPIQMSSVRRADNDGISEVTGFHKIRLNKRSYGFLQGSLSIGFGSF